MRPQIEYIFLIVNTVTFRWTCVAKQFLSIWTSRGYKKLLYSATKRRKAESSSGTWKCWTYGVLFRRRKKQAAQSWMSNRRV